jgi:tripartite-type tricarboxylate transporter receptor subunit TctC
MGETMVRRTFTIASLGAAVAIAAATPTTAQEFPTEPVEFIVPWSPGGGSDTLMRIVSNHIEPYLGEPMPVINMPGVSGTLGLEEATGREADGYTVAQVHEGLLVSHHTGVTDVNWDDFAPVAALTSSPQIVVTNADRPYETFEEFVAYAQENPGELKVGVTLAGVPHLHMAMIEEAAGIEFSYVGFEGTGERIRGLVGGHIDAAMGDIASAGEFVANGDLRFLATGSTERLEQAPDVPTLTELGYDLELTVNRGIVAPMGTPQARIDVIEAALEELQGDADYVESLNNAGAEAVFRDEEAYRTYLENLDATVERLASKLEG